MMQESPSGGQEVEYQAWCVDVYFYPRSNWLLINGNEHFRYNVKAASEAYLHLVPGLAVLAGFVELT